ncbi:MAG: UxaA family hydrolase [Deltaproteobacteria bacterium]|jgi:hypothetical protein|nr:UxaA family hydrolase [Deltaproteobacteria bacterium]
MESGDFLHMEGRKIALVLDRRDNVAVVLADVGPGEDCLVRGLKAECDLRAAEAVPFGHKVALANLAAGEAIRKYGEEIGVAAAPIPKGGWVHIHNLHCARGM